MPYKANEARRHKIPRARYRVTNWPEYDGALQRRGSLTVWVTPEALAAWHPPRTGRPGRSPPYAAIAMVLSALAPTDGMAAILLPLVPFPRTGVLIRAPSAGPELLTSDHSA